MEEREGGRKRRVNEHEDYDPGVEPLWQQDLPVVDSQINSELVTTKLVRYLVGEQIMLGTEKNVIFNGD